MSPIAERLEALDRAAALAAAHLPESVVEQAKRVTGRAQERLRHGTHFTVIALAGPTGAGKSTLFNAIVGSDVSQTGVRRPTTSEAHAAIFGDDGSAAALLDWLGIRHRHHVAGSSAEMDGLILIDLPDYDSTEALNRAEVDRLVELVDVLLWVVDPQKYADHVLHDGYLRPLRSHAGVMRFVLSKVDTLSGAERDSCLTDLVALLGDDGIPEATVIPLALVGGAQETSLMPVRALFDEELRTQRRAVDRIGADVDAAAHAMRGAMGASTASGDVLDRAAHRAVVDGLSRAAAIDASASAVGRQHQQDARLAMGWPLTRWMTRFRKRPIAERPVARTSAVADAEVSQVLRLAGETAAEGLPDQWTTALRRTADAQKSDVLTALDAVTHRTVADNRTPPRWWTAVTGMQYVAMVVAAVGALWLIALALIDGFLRIDVDIAAPNVGSMPLPTLLLLGGGLIGLVVAAVANLIARAGARRRAQAVRRQLREHVAEVAQDCILEPLSAVRNEHDHILTSLERAFGA